VKSSCIQGSKPEPFFSLKNRNIFFIILQEFLKSLGFLMNPTLSCISRKKNPVQKQENAT